MRARKSRNAFQTAPTTKPMQPPFKQTPINKPPIINTSTTKRPAAALRPEFDPNLSDTDEPAPKRPDRRAGANMNERQISHGNVTKQIGAARQRSSVLKVTAGTDDSPARRAATTMSSNALSTSRQKASTIIAGTPEPQPTAQRTESLGSGHLDHHRTSRAVLKAPPPPFTVPPIHGDELFDVAKLSSRASLSTTHRGTGRIWTTTTSINDRIYVRRDSQYHRWQQFISNQLAKGELRGACEKY